MALIEAAGPQVMVAVAHAVDHRNPLAQGHSSRVVAIVDAIGRRLSMPSSRLEELRMAAFLHDVGHMTLAAEGQTLEAAGHAEAGEMIVAGAKFPLEVVAAVGHHHDRWDAGGKADGVTGESIPLMARILSVAERFEAQTAGRGCPRLTQEESLAQVRWSWVPARSSILRSSPR